MEYLNTQSISTTFNSTQPTNGNAGPFEIKVPQSSVMVAKPLSYNFRVAEYTDKNGDVVKVGLQVAVFEHDNYGVRQLRQDWKDVERVRLPFVA